MKIRQKIYTLAEKGYQSACTTVKRADDKATNHVLSYIDKSLGNKSMIKGTLNLGFGVPKLGMAYLHGWRSMLNSFQAGVCCLLKSATRAK